MALCFSELRTLQATTGFHARRQPDHPALICENRVISYADLDQQSNRTAHALRGDGLAPGARVAYLGKESEHFYEILFACAKSGLVFVPINWRLTGAEVGHILRDSGAALLFVTTESAEVAGAAAAQVHPAPQVIELDKPDASGLALARWRAGQPGTAPELDCGPDTPVVQLYTSGTTGRPKGVVLAHHSFFAVRDALASQSLDWIDFGPDDISLIGIPGFHIGGMWWATQGFNAGVTNVVVPTFVSSVVGDLIRRHRVTTTLVVPAMLQMLLADRFTRADFASLRKVVYGGSPISEPLLRSCLDRIGCEFAQIYGLTETGNTAVCLPPDQHVAGNPRLKAAGRPYPGIKLKVIDDAGRPQAGQSIGEVCIQTPARMVEYWRRPDATRETLVDGWIHTGDAGYLDAQGYVYICDRIKDAIIVAGENVYPAEVEGALAKHPAILEAAVVGIPDERWGESARAFVVFRPGRHATPREISLALREHIADFKIPTSYEQVDTLPRNASGKILRRQLRERFWAGRDRQVN